MALGRGAASWSAHDRILIRRRLLGLEAVLDGAPEILVALINLKLLNVRSSLLLDWVLPHWS